MEARIEDSSELVESGQRSAKAKILSKESWVENTARGCVDTVTASHDHHENLFFKTSS